MKKIGKNILKVLGCTVVCLSLFVAGLSIYNHIKLTGDINAIKDKGYYNPVSTGDHSLNVYVTGNENGNHTIVALSGWSDGEMYISWRPLTSKFEDDNKFVFIDRAGYGLSDDVRESMTVDYVVEDYRTALRNAGIKGPYILLSHSLGSLYTAFWESAYPDEIEACIFMDGTLPISAEKVEEVIQKRSFSDNILKEVTYRLPYFLTHTGLSRIYDINAAFYGDVMSCLDPDDRNDGYSLIDSTYASRACLYEIIHVNSGETLSWTWENIRTNDIPKIYLASSDYKGALTYAEKLGNTKVYDLPGDHVIFLDRTEDCANIIAEFLASLDA